MLFQQAPVTFTGVEYVHGTDSLKVSVRMKYELFLRDYQQTIFDDLDLKELRSFKPFPADLANNYLNSKINIMTNGKQVIGKLLRMDVENDDVRFSILFRVNSKVKSITIKNTILTGLYSRVENLTIFKSRTGESSVKLGSDHPEETFFLKNQDK